MKAINWKSLIFLALVFCLFATIQGCPMPTAVLVEGEIYEVELQINADSSLYALEIEQEGDNDGDEDDDEDDCEQEGEHEGENEGCDGDDDEDDDEGDDEDECEQEGENEGENEGCDGDIAYDLEGEISAQVISIDAGRLVFELLPGYFVILVDDDDEGEIDRSEGDDDDHLTIADLEVGMWVEVEGEYENGMFVTEEIELADEAETEIEGAMYDITSSTFSMLGLTISYDDATEIEIDDDDDHDDDDDEEHED